MHETDTLKTSVCKLKNIAQNKLNKQTWIEMTHLNECRYQVNTRLNLKKKHTLADVNAHVRISIFEFWPTYPFDL